MYLFQRGKIVKMSCHFRIIGEKKCTATNTSRSKASDQGDNQVGVLQRIHRVFTTIFKFEMHSMTISQNPGTTFWNKPKNIMA